MKQISFTVILILTFCVFSFAQDEIKDCPKIKIIAPEFMMNLDEPVLFSVELNQQLNTLKVEYEWIVFSGNIVEGQKTSQVKIKPEIGAEKVTANVKVKGLPETCENSDSKLVNIVPSNFDVFPIDEYGKLSRNDERARLDAFLTNLSAEKDFQGIIHIFTAKNESNKSIKKHIQFMMNHFKFRNFPRERITFLIEKLDERKTRLWTFPKDFNFSLCEKCEVLKGADL